MPGLFAFPIISLCIARSFCHGGMFVEVSLHRPEPGSDEFDHRHYPSSGTYCEASQPIPFVDLASSIDHWSPHDSKHCRVGRGPIAFARESSLSRLEAGSDKQRDERLGHSRHTDGTFGGLDDILGGSDVLSGCDVEFEAKASARQLALSQGQCLPLSCLLLHGAPDAIVVWTRSQGLPSTQKYSSWQMRYYNTRVCYCPRCQRKKYFVQLEELSNPNPAWPVSVY
ncbi:hypothetical protein BDZ89DRAFT_1118859, partial [Hymenopellis radicata]